jgi:hypothetical protein
MANPPIITKLNDFNNSITDPNFSSNNPIEYSYLDSVKNNILINNASNNILSRQITNNIDLMKDKFEGRVKKIDDISQRKLEISRFYTLKYSKEISVLQKIVFICGLGLIGCLLFNIGMISNNFLSLYLGIVLAVGFVIVFYNLWDIYVRDNNDFDEYDYGIYGSKPGPDVLPANTQSMANHELSNLKC